MARSMDSSDCGSLSTEDLFIQDILLALLWVILLDVFFDMRVHPCEIWSASGMVSMPMSDQDAFEADTSSFKR
jgi:hypothetical protein